MIQTTAVIRCGGSGTRLWPLSRTGFPKQFLCLTGAESLFQQAAQRLCTLGNADIAVGAPLIVSGEDHRFLASEQLREVCITLGSALLEPLGRNTAPALTLAALAAFEGGNDPVLVVTPADQTVSDAAAFTAAMQQAILEADQGNIVILGVSPDRPETAYGYIQAAAGAPGGQNPLASVQRFVEKPDAVTAQSYLDQGGYFWNAGMFVLKASVWLKALEQFRPDILHATQQAWDKRSTDALRDWGHAKDYVRMQWMMLRQDQPEDFVIATGKQYSVPQFINWTTEALGKQLRWERTGMDKVGYFGEKAIVRIDPPLLPPYRGRDLAGRPQQSQTKTRLGTRDHPARNVRRNGCIRPETSKTTCLT